MRLQQRLIQEHLLPHWWLEVSNYDAVAYALGQREDFTLLQEVDVPPAYGNVARIYMVLGHLHAQASSALQAEILRSCATFSLTHTCYAYPS